jgi:thioredoxin-like negative regulator of GroEL
VDPAAADLPVYVPRDLDADLRTAITVAAEQGGLVLLVGGSSVGKTRAMFEAVRAVLPEWWLLHPADTQAVAELAADPPPRMVVWLDELQRYLDAGGGPPVGVVRALVGAGTVLVATIWPHEYTTRTAARVPGRPDPFANDREVLGLARVIDVPDTFSPTERRSAEDLADTDRRIRMALDSPDAGFTQVLAAGPELVRRWETAPDPYGRAVITAALDARRVGATAPVSREFLEAAAAGYLTTREQATAPATWLDRALDYATGPLHGATAVLSPVAAGMGRISGYTVADYLHQHALRTRRTTPLTDQAWQALVDHHHPHDTLRLADNAARRGRPAHALALYQHAANTGNESAAIRLVQLLAEHGRVDELRARADAGDEYAADWLADLLTEQGRIDEALSMLRARADTGDSSAARRLADLLAKQGHVDELRARADPGDGFTVHRLADLLIKHGHIEEALTLLRTRADIGRADAAERLADLLAKHGHVDEALSMLRAEADAGSRYSAPVRLADLLTKQGRIDELRARADAGDRYATERLADLLTEQGRVDELRARADAGDEYAAGRLADLLTEQGRIDEALSVLRARADAGNEYAAKRLAHLLAEQGRVDELQAEVHAGTIGVFPEIRALDTGLVSRHQARPGFGSTRIAPHPNPARCTGRGLDHVRRQHEPR